MKRLGYAVGIDLGTTYSSVAVLDGDTAKVLDDREGKSRTRSVVSLRKRKGKEPEILVGDVAANNLAIAPDDTILDVRCLIGRRSGDPEVRRVRERHMYKIVEPRGGDESVRVVMGGEEYSPVDISAMILRKLKEDAEFRLGEEVTDAVITVPAYLNRAQRIATRDAALKAGLRVITVLDEPTAIGHSFGMHMLDVDEPQRVVVYDLREDTFDVAVQIWKRSTAGILEPATLDIDGDMWLGGDDFDRVLVSHAVGHIQDSYGINPSSDGRFMAALRKQAQEAKERLSSVSRVDIIVVGLLKDDSGELIDVEMEITRSKFESMIKPLVDKTLALTASALERGTPLTMRMTHGRLTVEDINYVLMAGSGTNVPLVQDVVKSIFGREKVLRDVRPESSVARGAAIVAARLRGKVVCMECDHVCDCEAAVCQTCGSLIPQPELESEEKNCRVTPPSVGIAFETEKPLAGLDLPTAQPELEGKEENGNIIFRLGGVSPFQFGIQAPGGKYLVVIRKNDEYPTRNPAPLIFFTEKANQRMMTLPLYGGNNTESAGSNEKQGDLVIILPPQLAEGTPISVTIGLDEYGVSYVEAYLGDGIDLDPWIMHGETDARAMEILAKIEEVLASRPAELPQAQLKDAERIRNQALEEFRKHNFEGALDLAGQLAAVLDRGSVSGHSRAEGGIGH